MLEQVAAGFELEAEKKGISFEIQARPQDLTIKADPEKSFARDFICSALV